eukprot:CAMPEP_0180233306 /NCGR_PEP_ID=MMETSP0987-20121128/28002_1 /TAXON_ID=697907 /ORGANISM="non described non described, Strain CCMP2293" /LENGTH=186 /DNA_ID=CAMNT_0022199109 /DNA_START=472 /DNA_END=1033 /DNA_ORIENTATION=-
MKNKMQGALIGPRALDQPAGGGREGGQDDVEVALLQQHQPLHRADLVPRVDEGAEDLIPLLGIVDLARIAQPRVQLRFHRGRCLLSSLSLSQKLHQAFSFGHVQGCHSILILGGKVCACLHQHPRDSKMAVLRSPVQGAGRPCDLERLRRQHHQQRHGRNEHHHFQHFQHLHSSSLSKNQHFPHQP